MRKKGGKLRYEYAPDLQARMDEIINVLGMNHVRTERVKCLRSKGSSSRGTIARCHALGKVMQMAMDTKAWYAIEFLERFEKLNQKEQDKVIIHELLHIPKSFGGGFRHHDFVCEENVELMHQKFESLRSKKIGFDKNFGLDKWNYN